MNGYFSQTAASGFTSLAPDRFLDTRNGTGAPQTQLTSAKPITLQIAGVDGIPAGVTAVAVNFTLTDATGYGDVVAYPTGGAVPTASNANYVAGRTVANAAVVPVGGDGAITLAKQGPGGVGLIADVTGYYSANGPEAYVPLATPVRLRGASGYPTALAGGSSVSFSPAALVTFGTINFSSVTYVLNLTLSQTVGAGYVVVYPDEQSAPNASNVNYTASGQTVANLAQVATGSNGNLVALNGGLPSSSVHLIVDVFGFYSTN